MTAKASSEQWTLNKVLGSGGFGIVELWVNASNEKLAIKRCKWDLSQLTETQQNRWINEVRIMKRLNHPNIIKGLKLPFIHPNDKIELPVLCMEFCARGDLRKVLNMVENCCGISEKEAINVMKDISSAVEYLHSNNITHRDLKPENIVLQDKYNVISYKLIDLGYAKELGEASTSASIVGTLNYLAPELLWKQTYSCSVDYWSLGILFYELVTGARPFLPRMQHTMTWMLHVRSKTYDSIRAYESEGKIMFGTDIPYPTHLSRCLRDKLTEWFRIVLQWDPKQRGKRCDENGVPHLVVFKLLRTILSKQIIYVFCSLTYKLYAYEVVSTTSIAELKVMIKKDTNISVNDQILTQYFGQFLIKNKPLLSQIQDPILFVFKNGDLIQNAPPPDVPVEVGKLLELVGTELNIEILKDYYKVATFFFKQEAHLFKLYIFAITIKVDIAIERLNKFKENIILLKNTHTLFNKVATIRNQREKMHLSKETMETLESNFVKVTKLVKAAEQVQLQFDSLTQKSMELKDAAQTIGHAPMYQLFNKAVNILESCTNENSHRHVKPTEMVKLVFDFFKVREMEFCNDNITEIVKQIIKLEIELLTLERIFDSVTVMTTVYDEELQSICNCASEIPNANTYVNAQAETIYNTTTKSSTSNDAMEISDEANIDQLNTSNDKCNEITDTHDDLIYENLFIRHTLDNLLIEIQKNIWK